MTEAEELENIENEIADLGSQIMAKKNRALEIVGGRIGTIRGKRVRIDTAIPYWGGSICKLFFRGPVLTKDGKPHARQTESTPLILFDKIERAP